MEMKLFQRRTKSGPLLSFRPVRYCERHNLAVLDGDYCEVCPLRDR